MEGRIVAIGRRGLDNVDGRLARRALYRHARRRRDKGRQPIRRLLDRGLTRFARLLFASLLIASLLIAGLVVVAEFAGSTIVSEVAVVVIARLAILSPTILTVRVAVLVISILAIAILAIAILAVAILVTAVLRTTILGTTILGRAVLERAVLVAVTIAPAVSIIVLLTITLGPITLRTITLLPILPIGLRLLILIAILARLVGLATPVIVGLPILEWLRGGGLRRRNGHALGRRGETIRQRVEIVVAIVVLLGLFAGGPLVAVGGLLLGLLRGGDQPKIMLGVLQVALGHHGIARRLGVARQLQILFANVVGGTPDLNVGSIGLVGPRKRVRAFAIAAVVIISATHTLVLTRSHRRSLTGIRTIAR